MALNELCIAVDGITMNQVKKQIKKMIERKTKGLTKNVKNHDDLITSVEGSVKTLEEEGEILKEKFEEIYRYIDLSDQTLFDQIAEYVQILKDEIITPVEETTKTLKEEGEIHKEELAFLHMLMDADAARITEMEGQIALLIDLNLNGIND